MPVSDMSRRGQSTGRERGRRLQGLGGRPGDEPLNERRAICGVWELERQRLNVPGALNKCFKWLAVCR